jgi:hypothetical protein
MSCASCSVRPSLQHHAYAPHHPHTAKACAQRACCAKMHGERGRKNWAEHIRRVIAHEDAANGGPDADAAQCWHDTRHEAHGAACKDYEDNKASQYQQIFISGRRLPEFVEQIKTTRLLNREALLSCSNSRFFLTTWPSAYEPISYCMGP